MSSSVTGLFQEKQLSYGITDNDIDNSVNNLERKKNLMYLQGRGKVLYKINDLLTKNVHRLTQEKSLFHHVVMIILTAAQTLKTFRNIFL